MHAKLSTQPREAVSGGTQYVEKGGKLEDLMSQGNHPNRKGHALVAAALLEWFPH